MGLKESGLRGSLRNTSSVLPAFFDVTITNTNSPVQEGDILTVDYSADNTGGAQDTQDIRLEIDSVEEDRDSDITLLGAQSTTGTLEWDTTDEAEAEYTATVLSDDDSDSVTVEIEAAIPDSGLLHRYDPSELSGFSDGETITTRPDVEGSDDLSGTATYRENLINGLAGIEYDGVDDDHVGTFGSDISPPYTVFMVAKITNTSDDDGFWSGESAQARYYDPSFNDTGELRMLGPDGTVGDFSDVGDEIAVYAGMWKSGDAFARINGSEMASGDIGVDDLDGLTIANREDGGGEAEMDCGEVLVYNKEPSASEIDEIESYLADKWGVALS